MITAIVLWIVTLITLLIFIGLYIDETHRVQETYRKQYSIELDHASKEIELFIENKGDLGLRYRRISSYLSCASSYAFLINDFSNEQIIINEINTCLIKYPEQMEDKMEDLKQAIDDINNNFDKGYEEAKAVVNSINKLGN